MPPSYWSTPEILLPWPIKRASQLALVVKNPPANAGDVGRSFHPWVGKVPWRRKWLPTPVFSPGEPQDRGAWRATVHGVAKSRTRLKRLSGPLATRVTGDPAGGGRAHGHGGHLRWFSACFQESLTTYPSTASTSQPTSHSSKRGGLSCYQMSPQGGWNCSSHHLTPMQKKKVAIYDAAILLVKIWKPQCKINDANRRSLNVCDPWKKPGFSRQWWPNII